MYTKLCPPEEVLDVLKEAKEKGILLPETVENWRRLEEELEDDLNR